MGHCCDHRGVGQLLLVRIAGSIEVCHLGGEDACLWYSYNVVDMELEVAGFTDRSDLFVTNIEPEEADL